MRGQQEFSLKRVIGIAGAFFAWMVGSGFATGQEILQFFSSYGYMSYAVLLADLILFMAVTRTLFTTGFEHPEKDFDHFSYYTGKRMGQFYSWLVPVTLILIVAVMVSAAGSTLQQHYGIQNRIGSTIMTLAVLAAYLAGFEKMVKIVSSIGPVIILFVFLVGTVTVAKDAGNFSAIARQETALSRLSPSPFWLVSALSYSSLCIFTAGSYITAVGQTSVSRREARAGAMAGVLAFIGVLTVMNTAILLNSAQIMAQEIPTLYLATRISEKLAGVFSLILILGMFSTASTMMWSAGSRFFRNDPKKNRIFVVLLSIIILFLGQFPFSHLLGVFYPLIGYIGLIYIGGVLWKAVNSKLV